MLFFQNNWIAPAQLEAGLSPDRVRYSGNMSAFISIATAAILCKGTAWIVHSQAEEKMPCLFQKPTKQWQLSLHLLDFFFIFFFLKQPVGVRSHEMILHSRPQLHVWDTGRSGVQVLPVRTAGHQSLMHPQKCWVWKHSFHPVVIT